MKEDARIHGGRGIATGLRQIVQEASQALARLDPGRLEGLARECAVLQHDVQVADALERAEMAREARLAVGDMAVFARVLEATRCNLEVMRRLRDLRQGSREYAIPGGRSELQVERAHGID